MMVMVVLTLGMSALHTRQQTLGQGLCHNNICHKMKCLVVQMLILQHAMMLVPVSWRILLQNIVLHTDTALSNIMREKRVSVLYIGDIQARSSGPIIMVQCLESRGRDHSNNFIFGLKPNSVIPRRLSEW